MWKRLKGKTKNNEGSADSVDSGYAGTEKSLSPSSSSSSIPSILGTGDKQSTLTKNKHGSTSTLSSTTTSIKEFDEEAAIENRINKFLRDGWTQPVSVKDLAEAGFLSTGEGDEVECVSCRGRISGWKAGEVPLTRHRKTFPKCSFAKYKRKQMKKKRKIYFDSPQRSQKEESSDDDEHDDDTKFSSEFDRLITFNNWPLSSPVDQYDLAASGFYRVSPTSNEVQCYACDGKVKEWNLGDRPKKKHEQLYPECPHLKSLAENKPLHSSEKKQAVNISIQNERTVS